MLVPYNREGGTMSTVTRCKLCHRVYDARYCPTCGAEMEAVPYREWQWPTRRLGYKNYVLTEREGSNFVGADAIKV